MPPSMTGESLGLPQPLTTSHPALNLSLPPCGLKNNGTALPVSQPVAVATPSRQGMEIGPGEKEEKAEGIYDINTEQMIVILHKNIGKFNTTSYLSTN